MRWLCLSLLPAWLFLGLASGQEKETVKVEELDEFQAALRALDSDLPSVAAEKLQRLYRETGTVLPANGRSLLIRVFFESLIRSERYDRILQYSERPFFAADPATPFWRGLALGRRGSYTDAINALRLIARDESHPYTYAAALAASGFLLQAQRPEAAIEILQPLFRSQVPPGLQAFALLRAAGIHVDRGRPDEAKALLRMVPDEVSAPMSGPLALLNAKIALAEGRNEEAAEATLKLMESAKNRNLVLHNRALLVRADALLALQHQQEAVTLLQQFVSSQADSPLLPAAYQKLDEAGFFSSSQLAVNTWLQSASPQVRSLTLFYRCGWEERDAARISGLETFIRDYPEHPLLAAARVKLALIKVSTAPAESSELLAPLQKLNLPPALRQAVADIAARAQFEQGQFASAAQAFRETASPQERPARDVNRAFNSAVAAIYGNAAQILDQELQQLALDEQNRDVRIQLELERGLYLAARNHPNAIALLKNFVRDHPGHSRTIEAEIAIAELYLLVGFPIQTEKARHQLESLAGRKLSPALQQQVDYVAFWVEAIEGNRDSAVAIGRKFLQTWPESPQRFGVLMKIGEIHFSARDFAQAQSTFDELVAADPKGPFSEAALFFSAKSAVYSMNRQDQEEAIRKWRVVIDRGGPLANEARHQQSLAKLRQGNPREALAVIEALLDPKRPISPELRLAALTTKGQALFDLAQASPEKEGSLVAAVATFDQIIEDRYANRFWVNQASLHKGRCLEILGDDDKALEVYFNVVSRNPLDGLNGREAPEYTWYYRAGFAAISILRERQEWRSAVRLAERLGATSGPRAEEAAELANRLRLLHFIWDEDQPAAASPESVPPKTAPPATP